MIIPITVDQISDDALAALDDAFLPDLEFGLDVDAETVYCANHDERGAWRWDHKSTAWVEVDWHAYHEGKSVRLSGEAR